MGNTQSRTVAALLLCVAGLAPLGCEDPDAADKAAIRAVLEQLDQANESCDGDAAVAVMSSDGLAEYDRIVRLALDGSRAQVMSLSPQEMSLVVEIRNRIPLREAAGMDGRAYQKFATSECWYSGLGSDWAGMIGAIQVHGDVAYADVLGENGRKSGISGEFTREDGVWKVNEFSFNRAVDEMLTRWAAEEGVSVPELVLLMEEDDWGGEVSDRIWEPMR